MAWLLLLHQIPPTPNYFRAKVLRRLTQLGALCIKNSAYLLPATPESQEDLEWLGREITEEGGDAWLFRAEALSGLSDDSIRESFRRLRAPDYASQLDAARKLLDDLRAGIPAEPEFRKLKRRYEETRAIDYFHASGQEEMETLMTAIENALRKPAQAPAPKPAASDLNARTWVTRRGIKVDRIASAWLIRRFLDPAARFVFVDPEQYTHAPGELRFDMFDGEFTHEGDKCTFEVLLALLPDPDAGLVAISEIVHDIDLKEDRYERPEKAGIAPLIEGLALRHADDAQRLEEGAALFEALYTRLRAA